MGMTRDAALGARRTALRRTALLVARAAAWAAGGAAMLLVPAATGYAAYVDALPAGWEHMLPFWHFVPWSPALPFALAVAALAYASRDRLLSRRRVVAVTALAAVASYLVAACVLNVDRVVGTVAYAILSVERPLRYVAWGLWGAVFAAWVLPMPADAPEPASPLDGQPGAQSLTEREREVADLLVSGCTQAQAAEALGISTSSVGTYRSRACEKLGLASLDELVPRVTGAAAEPPVMDAGGAGASVLMALALCAGMLCRLVAEELSGGRPYASDYVLIGACCALPWAALLVYARVKGMRVRHRRVSARLWLVLATLGLLGFCVYESAAIRVGTLPVLTLVAYVACVVLLAPYLLWPTVCETTALDEERCVLYLRGRGAGELQAHVLTQIAQGRSTPEICEDLHVARGTVNSYRAQGYELVGVHSSRELADLLARDVGRVPSAGKNRPSAESEKNPE